MDPHAVSLLVELLSGQVLQAPGGAASTRRALAAVELPSRPRVADLGCGRGASALILAEHTGGHVLAVDLLPQMVEATRRRAADAGLDVQAVVGDMAGPPIEPASLDLLWSEGAAYSIGFGEALGRWRPLLRPGGFLGVTELCWRSEPDPEAARYWSEVYPAITDADTCRAMVASAGLSVVEDFFLPASDWRAYYEPIAAALPGFRRAHADDPVAAAVADEMQAEVEAWRRWGDAVGYLFLVAKAG